MKNTEKKKKTISTMLLGLGIALLPFAYLLWVADRIMFVIIPQTEHPKLMDFLNNKLIVFAITRIATLTILFYITKWLFGF